MDFPPPITLFLPDEGRARTGAAPTPTVSAFIRFLGSLSAFVAAERDLLDCPGWDPATDAWVVAAERARAAVLADVWDVTAQTIRRPCDLGLRELALVIRAAIASEDPDEVAELRRRARAKRATLAGPGVDPSARRLVREAVSLFERLLDLDDEFADRPDRDAPPDLAAAA